MKRLVKSNDIHGRQYDVPVDKLEWRPSAYAIVIKDNKILLGRQFGKYHLPGGGIELGESPEDAVVREVFEETGYEVTNPKVVEVLTTFFSWEDQGREWHYHTILLFYVCEFRGGKPSIENMEEGEDNSAELPEWVSLDDLEDQELGSTFDWLSIVRRVAA